jgi:NAD(P)H dehydrogenase (quinone)
VKLLEQSMIVVTGATGQLGSGIVESLIRRMPSKSVGVSVRDPGKAADLAAQGVRVRHGDFAKADSLPAAFEGASQLMLVSSNARASGGDTLAQHRSAIAAARAAGVKRIVYTSHMAASGRSEFAPMHDHAATEELLRESGVAWTSLRNGFYAAAGIMWLGDAPSSGLFEAPADGKVSWTAHSDLAEAAALVLTTPGRFDGPTPPLTASEALSMGELAALASELTLRPLRRAIITDDELRARLSGRGLPRAIVDISLGFYRASRHGEFQTVDPTLEQLLGRKPVSMRTLLQSKLEATSS